MQFGKKLITGHTNGEIHIWNGVNLKFDTVNSVHEDGVKVMKWVKDMEWLVTADKKGFIIYWNPTLKAIHSHQAHTSQVRDMDFSSSWSKFVS
jgi:WD40 repeat protein